MNNYVCKRCGALKTQSQSEYCAECELENYDDIKRIEKYLANNRNANIASIATGTGISLKVINTFIKEGAVRVV